MSKLSIVILDSDHNFLERTSNYLINKTDKFTVSSFSDLEKFKQFIENTKQDILLFSQDYLEEIKSMDINAVKIFMYESSEHESEGFFSIKKYQKIDKFVKEILFIYSENTGDSSYILSKNEEKKIIAIYSPVGGSGKTTLSVLLAKNLALGGANVLYLNFERISSMAGIFNNDSINNMTEIFLTARMNKNGIAAKILSNTVQNQASKIYYINPAESSSEYAQMTDDEIMSILDAAECLDEFDYVIIDFLGEFNKRVFDILKRCRKIIFPYLNHELSIKKTEIFMQEMKKLKYESSILANTIFVENMSDDVGLNNDVIKIPYREAYKNIKAALKNYGVGFEDLEPIIRQL